MGVISIILLREEGCVYAFFSLRNACTVVPQTEQVPFMACLPFFMVTS